MLDNFKVKIPTFIPWFCFPWVTRVGHFWRQNQRSDKPLFWHCTICVWCLYLMYLVKDFTLIVQITEGSIGLHYTPSIVTNVSKVPKVKYCWYSTLRRQSINAQTQRPGEFEMQWAMLISFKLICLLCFSANFLLCSFFSFKSA